MDDAQTREDTRKTRQAAIYSMIEPKFIMAGVGLVICAALLMGGYISSGEFVGLTIALAGAYITSKTITK